MHFSLHDEQGTAGLSLPEGVKLKDALSTLVDEMGWAELAEQTGTLRTCGMHVQVFESVAQTCLFAYIMRLLLQSKTYFFFFAFFVVFYQAAFVLRLPSFKTASPPLNLFASLPFFSL